MWSMTGVNFATGAAAVDFDPRVSGGARWRALWSISATTFPQRKKKRQRSRIEDLASCGGAFWSPLDSALLWRFSA